MEEDTITKCFCCDNWIRVSATKLQKTGDRELLERWCLSCLTEVDSITEATMLGLSTSGTLELEGEYDD
jgi:hypothetical protein